MFNKLDAYRYHMEQLQAKGVVETTRVYTIRTEQQDDVPSIAWQK